MKKEGNATDNYKFLMNEDLKVTHNLINLQHRRLLVEGKWKGEEISNGMKHQKQHQRKSFLFAAK